jgi:hypothetical protein
MPDGMCDVSKFAVFTKVEKFVGWINANIGKKIELHCEYSTERFAYKCEPKNLKIESENILVVDATGAHTGSLINRDVNALDIRDQQTSYLPSQISDIFPSLVRYYACNSDVKVIDRSNFAGLSRLSWIEVCRSPLETIPKDAFYDVLELDLLVLPHQTEGSLHLRQQNRISWRRAVSQQPKARNLGHRPEQARVHRTRIPEATDQLENSKLQEKRLHQCALPRFRH